MFQLKVIQHADVSKNELDEIIRIKSTAWPYPYKMQMEWIKNNLKNSDLHLLLLHNNNFVAYLNLIKIELIIDNRAIDGLGVGNVCTTEKGIGLGNELILKTNQFIIHKKKTGLLFCKQKLVNFYENNDWTIINKDHLIMQFDNEKVVSMIYNYPLPFHELTFTGSAF